MCASARGTSSSCGSSVRGRVEGRRTAHRNFKRLRAWGSRDVVARVSEVETRGACPIDGTRKIGPRDGSKGFALGNPRVVRLEPRDPPRVRVARPTWLGHRPSASTDHRTRDSRREGSRMNRANSATVQYGTPGSGKDAASRPQAGRRCEATGCTTVLSTYNAATTCWLHSAPNPRHALAAR